MGFLASKFNRAREAAYLLSTHAADLQSSAALAGCYTRLFRSVTDSTEICARLRIDGRVFPFQFRKCDIFTFAEVLYERQYQLRTALPQRPVIIDAGANIGVATAWFLSQYPGAIVHCFEPQSDNFRLLKANLGKVEGVHLHRAAVGAASGEIVLHLAAHGAEHSTACSDSSQSSEVVPVVRLADLFKEHRFERIDLLKLDVEGSEIDALLGLGDHLEMVRVIVGEVHERLVDATRFYDLLKSAGFEVLPQRPSRSGGDDGVHQFEAMRPNL